MPRGSAPGERRGGRQKGTPNKATLETRALFAAGWERLAPDVEHWIRETAAGVEVTKTDKDGNVVKYRAGADPGKAAALALQFAEFHIPRLGRQEHVGDNGGPIVFTIKEET